MDWTLSQFPSTISPIYHQNYIQWFRTPCNSPKTTDNLSYASTESFQCEAKSSKDKEPPIWIFLTTQQNIPPWPLQFFQSPTHFCLAVSTNHHDPLPFYPTYTKRLWNSIQPRKLSTYLNTTCLSQNLTTPNQKPLWHLFPLPPRPSLLFSYWPYHVRIQSGRHRDPCIMVHVQIKLCSA